MKYAFIGTALVYMVSGCCVDVNGYFVLRMYALWTPEECFIELVES
jgi:hypothetical protein